MCSAPVGWHLSISKSHRLISWQRGFYISFVVGCAYILSWLVLLIRFAHVLVKNLYQQGYLFGFNLQFTFSVLAHWPEGIYLFQQFLLSNIASCRLA